MNPPIVYEVTKPTAQRTSKITAMVQSIFHHLHPWTSIRKEVVSSKLPRRTVPGQLREVCLPGMTHVDDDLDGVRRIQCEESPCQPQQVVVVVRPFRFSLLHDNTNGIFDLPDGIHPIDRDRSHRVLLFSTSFNRGQTHSRITQKIIPPTSLRYPLLSEMQVAVCPNFESVFVLWFRSSVGICFRGE